jgi:NarL family two-component system response regulator YdfI
VIRVFIVAASPLARSGLQRLLADRDVEIIGSAADIDSFVSGIAEAEADALLVDASGEHSESLIDSLTRFDLSAEIPIILLAAGPAVPWPGETLRAGFRAGVRAVLPVDASPQQLLAALQAVTSGLFVLHPNGVEALAPAASPASRQLTELAEPLTRREREVLQMLAAGLANKEIATRLSISDHTAKFHVASILGKLGAATRAEAVTLGIRRGLVLL